MSNRSAILLSERGHDILGGAAGVTVQQGLAFDAGDRQRRVEVAAACAVARDGALGDRLVAVGGDAAAAVA